ncbi:hypothetical protein BDQ17DRAFT_1524804 [Cyathus striatus]|nr:hypothetical protein BDQ17DRAFT_1524804 [Cyathus striatus]
MAHPTVQSPIRIIIVGGGIGGLSAAYTLGRAGHHVTVLETASTFNEDLGAGLQLSCNVTRLLIRWGLGHKLKELAVVPQELCLRRYKNGELIGWVKWGDKMEKDYGSPYYHIHRADLHNILIDLARPYITLRMNSKVTNVDPWAPSVTLQSGETISADVIIGADGVKSRLRDIVVGGPDRAKPTGDSAYRALIPTDLMMKDPELKQLVDRGSSTIWMGHNRHMVGYCLVSCEEAVQYRDASSFREDNDNVRPGDCDVMRDDYKEFEPRVARLLKLVPETFIWSLMDHEPLDTWNHPSGKLTLLGDACHPMLPYRAQGGAMAVEDAAVLGHLFTKITSPRQIPSFLKAYEQIRKPRATETQLASRKIQKIFHHSDGPEQEARDASMRHGMEVALSELRGECVTDDCEGNSNLWADRVLCRAQFEYDADEVVMKWWAENGDAVLKGGVLEYSML